MQFETTWTYKINRYKGDLLKYIRIYEGIQWLAYQTDIRVTTSILCRYMYQLYALNEGLSFHLTTLVTYCPYLVTR